MTSSYVFAIEHRALVLLCMHKGILNRYKHNMILVKLVVLNVRLSSTILRRKRVNVWLLIARARGLTYI